MSYTYYTVENLNKRVNRQKYRKEESSNENVDSFYDEYKDELEYIYIRFLLCSSLKRMCKISNKTDRKKALKETWNNINLKFPSWRKNPILKKKSLKNLYIKSNNKITFKIYCFFLHLL